MGQAPLAATVYELDRLRCNLCGEVFTAEEPEGVGPEKYDETTAAMIALLKYGSGMPFYRLEKLEHLLGIPLPASTQWEIVKEAAEVMKAARDELIRQAAQGEVLHNDDTSMRVLHLAREPSDDRTGVFTSGIVSTQHTTFPPTSRVALNAFRPGPPLPVMAYVPGGRFGPMGEFPNNTWYWPVLDGVRVHDPA